MLTEDEDSRAGKRKVKREEEGKEKGSGETKGTKSREKESERCFLFFPARIFLLSYQFTAFLYILAASVYETEHTPKNRIYSGITDSTLEKCNWKPAYLHGIYLFSRWRSVHKLNNNYFLETLSQSQGIQYSREQ